MLVKIIDEHHPQGVVVAWDAGYSGREQTYVEDCPVCCHPQVIRVQISADGDVMLVSEHE